MKTTRLPIPSLSERVTREVERERQERVQNDEARTGLSASEEFRTKDARESANAIHLKRSTGR